MKMSLVLRLTLSCMMLSAAANACAGDRQVSLDWLKTVAFAAHQTDYSGVIIYQHDNLVETSRIIHVVEPGSEYEKLESLDGPKREIIRHHGQIWRHTNRGLIQVGSQQWHARLDRKSVV